MTKMKAEGATRLASLFILLANACLYVITIGLSSWALNSVLNYGQVVYVGSSTSVATVVPTYGNVATLYFALVTLISGVVGLAAVFLGLQQVMSWKVKTLAAANSATMIAWLLSLLSMGLACKEISLGGRRNHRLRTLEGFVIFLPWILLLQLTMLHAAIFFKPAEELKRQYPYGEAHGPVAPPRQTV